MIRVTIDGRVLATEPDRTVLEAAREVGVPIPTLCHHEALHPVAACRMCVVEIETPRGRQLVASCAYPCSDGLVVHTDSETVLRSRRTTVSLLMAASGHTAAIRALADDLGVSEPAFQMERDDCILCGLCVRACKEIVGVGAISLVHRGIDKRVGTPFRIASGVCIECATCVLVCPTGAITLADITGGAATAHPWPSRFEAIDCRLCGHDYTAPQIARAHGSTDQGGAP